MIVNVQIRYNRSSRTIVSMYLRPHANIMKHFFALMMSDLCVAVYTDQETVDRA